MANLLQRLVEKQEGLDLTDEDFAARLGVSRALWQGTRTGRFRISESVLRGVRRQFPELIPELLVFLDEDASKSTDVVS